MNKFNLITISYYPYFSHKNTTVCYGDADAEYMPFIVTLNVDSIMSIADKPRTLKVYKSYKDAGTDACVSKNLHLLTTNAGVGRGINGVDFKDYFITEKSYQKLMDVLNPVQCI